VPGPKLGWWLAKLARSSAFQSGSAVSEPEVPICAGQGNNFAPLSSSPYVRTLGPRFVWENPYPEGGQRWPVVGEHMRGRRTTCRSPA